jgi:hypothetical protein
MLLAFSVWLISFPFALYGLIWCLSWIVPKSIAAHPPVPEFLAYPFYIIMWFVAAFMSIAVVGHRLDVAVVLLGLLSVFWPRTPVLVRAITSVVLILSVVGLWVIESKVAPGR